MARQMTAPAADLFRAVDSSGASGCVVNLGVPPMLGYLDAPEQFAVVTEPGQLDLGQPVTGVPQVLNPR